MAAPNSTPTWRATCSYTIAGISEARRNRPMVWKIFSCKQCDLGCQRASHRGRPLPLFETRSEESMHIIWGQRIWQLGINHARSSLCRSGVGYHVGVPQLLVVGGTDQYSMKLVAGQFGNSDRLLWPSGAMAGFYTNLTGAPIRFGHRRARSRRKSVNA